MPEFPDDDQIAGVKTMKPTFDRITEILEEKQNADLSIPFTRGILANLIVSTTHPRIDNLERLNELPLFAIVVREYTSDAGRHLHEVWQRLDAGWYCLGAPLRPPSQNWGTPRLPVILVWTPDA